MKKIIIGVIVIAVIGVAVFFGKQYYDDRYVGSDYYTVVPANYDMTPQMKYGDGGGEMGMAVEYKLTAYNDKGESKQVEFSVLDKDSGWATAGEYYQPGTYLKVSASKQIVIRQEAINKDQVPEAVLDKLKK